MKKLELWLDESGEFTGDRDIKKNPSLVGGVLIEEGKINERIAEQIIGKEQAHFNQEDRRLHTTVLEKIKSYGGKFVIAENSERIVIIDSDTTYLNILSEGIIQILLLISAEYGDFELSIRIATRKNMVLGMGIISPREYETRLREKVILGLARRVLTRKNKWRYTIEFDDARSSKRLMLADCVCNTYLTRTSGKFTSEEKKKIGEMYSERYKFSLFENQIEKEIQRLIVEGKIGDVLFELYLNNEITKCRKNYLAMAIERLNEFDEYGVKIQLADVISKIEAYFRIWRDYSAIKPVLINIQNELLAVLRERKIPHQQFALDIKLFLYTVYTHEGSIEAEVQDRLLKEDFRHIEDLSLKFTYFNLYQNRQAVHQKNMLNLTGCIESLTKHIDLIHELHGLMEILDDRGTGTTKNETLGKLYGTRGQAYIMLSYMDLGYIDLAIADFRTAISQFTKRKDVERQYLYISQAYCATHNYIDAFHYLAKAVEVETCSIDDSNKVLQKICIQPINDGIYKYLCYVRILAGDKSYGLGGMANVMFKEMINEKVNFDGLKKNYNQVHPLQFIYWYLARYYQHNGNSNAATKYYDMAIELCGRSHTEVTIRIIQLGIMADKALFFLKLSKVKEADLEKSKLRIAFQEITTNVPIPSILQYLEMITDNNDIDESVLHQLVEKTKYIN